MSAGGAKKHLVFIVNPRSGTDRIKAIQTAIDSLIDKSLYTHETQYTQHAKHGTELARDAAEHGAHVVIAVGGDGSVADVATGLEGSRTALGIIPKGSGNGMARSLGLPLKVEEAIKLINIGKTLTIDLGYVNDKLFVSNAGVGFDALISNKFATSKRRGLSVYSWLVTKHLWLYKEWDWQLEVDGEKINSRAFLVNVANGQQFGYNFRIAPQASFTDGWLDVTIIRKFPKIFGGALAMRAMWGNITDSKYVTHYRAKRVNIFHPDLRLMQTDGDAHSCTNRLNFWIAPKAMNVIVP
ncbi:MAG: diacylglycerol kinase family protein [Chitinophagaceae bacterium]